MGSAECWCGAKATSRCSACKREAFCSKSHQEMIWKFHKLNCKDIDTPIFIRQPKLSFEEYNIIQFLIIEEMGNDWNTFTAVEKQENFETYNILLERSTELKRHELLITNRVVIIQTLQSPGSRALDRTGPQVVFFPFYALASLEGQLQKSNLDKEGIFPIEFQKVFRAFFIYSFWCIGFIDGRENGSREDTTRYLREPAKDRLLTEVIAVEKQKIKGCEILAERIRDIVM